MNSTRETSHLAEPKIVCPHCWANFYQDEAKYIATHPKLYGDDVLGDAFHRRLTKQEVNWSRDGVMSDPQGGKVTEQACPVCHLQIPPDVLSRRPIFSRLSDPTWWNHTRFCCGEPSPVRRYYLR